MKSFVATGLLAAALALTANVAMAGPSPADPYPNGGQVAQTKPALHVAVRRPQLRGRLNVDIAQFIQGMLGGGPIRYASLAADIRGLHGSSGGSSYAPSYDTSNPIATGNDAQAASDAENQAIEQMNDTNAMTASMAAAEEENDEANAATLQTEINAGM